MKTNIINVNSGVYFIILLFLVFLILKLTKVITWSWLWVTSPIWIGSILIFLFVLFVYILIKIIDKYAM